MSATSLTRLLGPPAAGGDNALIHLPADCEEAKKKGERNNRSSSPAWCLGVNCEWMTGAGGGGGGGGAHIHPCFIVPSSPHRPVRQL